MRERGLRPIWNSLWHAPKWPLLLGVFLVLVGMLILLAGPEPVTLYRKLIGALFSELGFAFLIAFVLHSTLEFHARYENDREISRGILSYVYQVDLDDDMFFSTEEYIFKSDFYRSDLEIEYDFLKVDNGNIFIKYIVWYTVKNVSNSDKIYKIQTHIEKPFDGTAEEPSKPKDILLGLDRISIDNKPISKEDLKKADAALEDDDDYIRCMHPLELAPGQSKKIQMIHYIRRFERDAELWRSLVPCSGLTIRVRWKPEMNLKFSAQAIHPCDAFETLDIDDHSLNASINRPFFPQNGVYLWWAPISAKP